MSLQLYVPCPFSVFRVDQFTSSKLSFSVSFWVKQRALLMINHRSYILSNYMLNTNGTACAIAILQNGQAFCEVCELVG